jgi:hypothetical protein
MQYVCADTAVLEPARAVNRVSEKTPSCVNIAAGCNVGFTGRSAGIYDVQYSASPTTQICGDIPDRNTEARTPGGTLAPAADASFCNGIYNVDYSDHRTSGANRSLALNCTAASGISGR